MTLSDFKLKDKGIITNIKNGRIKSRLFDMGLKVGNVFTVFAVAPIGSPIGIKCGNIRLAIAKSTAEEIVVAYAE